MLNRCQQTSRTVRIYEPGLQGEGASRGYCFTFRQSTCILHEIE